MGSIKKAIDSVTGKQDQAQVKQRLELLLTASKAKIQLYRQQINEQFLNPASIEKEQIPGIRAIKYIEQYHVTAKSGFSQAAGDHIGKAIDAFFSIGGKDASTKDAIKGGVKELISAALDIFIGTTEAGESEEKLYIIIPENNAFVRVDIALWKYHMNDSSITDNNDSAVAYVLCKSVVDHTKLKIDELLYLVSDMLSTKTVEQVRVDTLTIFATSNTPTQIIGWGEFVDGTPGKTYFKDATELNDGFIMENDMLYAASGSPKAKSGNPIGVKVQRSYEAAPGTGKPKVNGGSATPKDNIPANWTEYLGSSSEAPSIRDASAYITELVRVWNDLKEQTSR